MKSAFTLPNTDDDVADDDRWVPLKKRFVSISKTKQIQIITAITHRKGNIKHRRRSAATIAVQFMYDIAIESEIENDPDELNNLFG